MSADHDSNAATILRTIIETHIRERGLTLEKLAGTEFSMSYIAALISGRVVPSHLTLSLLASRLVADETQLVEAARRNAQDTLAHLDLAAQEEDLTYAFNCILHSIRLDRTAEAMEDLEQVASQAEPYMHLIGPGVTYQFTFLRARAFAQQARWQEAEGPLLEAVKVVSSTREGGARAHVHNLLGAVYYAQQQQRQALREHLVAFDYVVANTHRDLNFSLTVFQNLANDYLALGYGYQAANAYRRALQLVEHLDADERKARLYWGLAETYRKLGKYVQAVTCGLQARDIYKVTGSKGEAVAVLLNLSEMLLENGRYSGAADLLEQGSVLLGEVAHPGLAAYLHLYKSRLAREQRQLEGAAVEAIEGMRLADALLKEAEGSVEASDPSINRPWISPARVMIETTWEAALVEAALDHFEAAERHFKNASDLARRTGMEDLRREVMRSYALHLQAVGNDEEAAHYFRESMEQ